MGVALIFSFANAVRRTELYRAHNKSNEDFLVIGDWGGTDLSIKPGDNVLYLIHLNLESPRLEPFYELEDFLDRLTSSHYAELSRAANGDYWHQMLIRLGFASET